MRKTNLIRRCIIDTLQLFVELGFRHILEGYDHLLFLAGLILATKNWKSLLSIISAFTVAHSTTLVLSAMGLIALKPALTETLIAASIAYVGIENVVRKKMDYRWMIAGGFGLIHGAGFSGHLVGILRQTMDTGNIWYPLLGFNVGIEAGQFTVVCLTLPVLWLLHKNRREELIYRTLSQSIAVVGILLVILRVGQI